jgi:hypothetical protein
MHCHATALCDTQSGSARRHHDDTHTNGCLLKTHCPWQGSEMTPGTGSEELKDESKAEAEAQFEFRERVMIT